MSGEATILPVTPNVIRIFLFVLLFSFLLNFLNIFLPVHIGTPIATLGTATPAINAMITGAPINVATCQRITFFLLHCFLPQNVQPDGLEKPKKIYENNK